MPAHVTCPHCSVKLNIPENLLGKKVRCATCSNVFESKAAEPDQTAPALEELPEAPLDEAGIDDDDGRARPWKNGDDADEIDEDRDQRRRRRRRRRGMRRDLVPHRGAMILTFGILSVVLSVIFSVLCCLIAPFLGAGFGIPAVLMGHSDIRQIRAGSMDPDGEGQARAGLILGYVGIGLAVMCLLGLVAYLFFFVLMTAGRVR
jgi:hypothetical protein